eukprot:TRINITY_DN10458_c0_g1_i1.p1 TRINITY_DN10458_c0_g1~~TRINITY_DN10458_c0_g1_i1.p1  ORF type:complete len:142 (+),score=30.07 TRINITY_DN10458_c0_g1_i1:170-595(+)
MNNIMITNIKTEDDYHTQMPMGIMAQPEQMVQSSEIYFCFEDEKDDTSDAPNRLILATPSPTVNDLCNAIKALFFSNHVITLYCVFLSNGSESTEIHEGSLVQVPVNNSSNVVLIKTRYQEQETRLNMDTIESLLQLFVDP